MNKEIVMAGLVPAISLKEGTVPILIGITGTWRFAPAR